MEKLELKHLAPYLPYELRIDTMHGVRTMDSQYSNDKEINIGGVINTANSSKPILRPLSDLTKEIDFGNGKPVRMIDTFFKEATTLLKKELKNTNGRLIVDYLTWEITDKLIRYHFDIFGLIGKGLAFDINTIDDEI